MGLACGDEYIYFVLAYQRCKDYGFVLERHRKWQECAAYQQRCVCSGEFLQVLISGLHNSERPESLVFCNQWELRDTGHLSQLQARYYNSPFGRTWNILFNIPGNLALKDLGIVIVRMEPMPFGPLLLHWVSLRNVYEKSTPAAYHHWCSLKSKGHEMRSSKLLMVFRD